MKKFLLPIILAAVAGLVFLAWQLLPSEAPADPDAPPSGAPFGTPAVGTTARPTPSPTPLPTATPEPTPGPTPPATPRPTATPVPDLPLAEEPVIDDSEADNAVLIVRMSTDSKMKVQISRQGTTVTNDLPGDNLPVRYPLTLGPGEYKVTVLENVGGIRYREVASATITGEWEDPNTPFLQSTQRIRWDISMDPILEAIKIAAEVGDAGRVEALYGLLSQTLVYDFDLVGELPTGYLPSIEETFRTRRGICYDFSSLMGAMLRSVGVPCKLTLGYATIIDGRHAWNEILVGDEWVVCDLTVDSIYREDGIEFSFAKDADDYYRIDGIY